MRVIQDDWDKPNCNTWIEKIERDLQEFRSEDLVFIGHSIGCMAIIHWFEKYQHRIKGALLVAPSDAERTGYPKYIRGFAPIPMSKLPFPSIVVGSSNDHVITLERTKEFAESWGSELIILENAGHIEGNSGYGEWTEGLKMIEQLNK